MRRREFLVGAVLAASLSHLHAQTRRAPTIGVLWHGASDDEEKVPLGHLIQGLSDIGYFQDRNIFFEQRFPSERPERFASLAKELVEAGVDVLVGVNQPSSIALHNATATVPIVFVDPDPVGDGLAYSLAYPGGNLTGLSTMAMELTAKRVELLNEAIQGITRVALMVNGLNVESAQRYLQAGRSAAAPLGVSIEPIEVRGLEEFEGVFADMEKRGITGLVLAQEGLLYVNREQIGKLALRHRIATVVYTKEMLEAGGLISYAPSYPLIFKRVAYFVDKILRGANPGELPVEQPTKFELLINERTAATLQLSVGPTLLARADEVIE